MYKRQLSTHLLKYLNQYPVVTITGPRQSGKTTLAETTLPDYQYVSLEDLDRRQHAIEDPRGFLSGLKDKVILDEVQQVPELFSYIQTLVDGSPSVGRFVLTGSHQFLLNERIVQTLAGRAARLRLLPLSLAELLERPAQTLFVDGQLRRADQPARTLEYHLLRGFYPRVHTHDLDPAQFYRDYVNTYVTRDLQQLIQVGDLRVFQNFLRLLAGRVGQPLNLTSIGNDIGVSHTTIKRWLSVLEASYIIVLLQPYYKNFSKRIVKSPKVYFLDTGLLCYLLRVRSEEELPFHPHLGSIFESYVVGELWKMYQHQDLDPPLYFWQERDRREIDCIIDHGIYQDPLEIKASQTLNSRFFEQLDYWKSVADHEPHASYLVYGGNEWQARRGSTVVPWYGIS